METTEEEEANRRRAAQLLQDEASRTNMGFRIAAGTQGGPAPPIITAQQQATATPAFAQQNPPAQQFSMTNGLYPSFSSAGPDPGLSGSGLNAFMGAPLTAQEAHDVQVIRAMIPESYRAFSDRYLLAQPTSVWMSIIQEEKKSEAARTAKSLEAKHYSNFTQATANPVLIPAGYDNRESTYHVGRTLPGAGVSLQFHWHQGRNSWGQNGVPTITNYDTDSLGISGCITARGWEALHHPGSGEMSIKLFTVANMVHSSTGSRTVSLAGDNNITIQESWKEVQDISELKTAINNICTASQLCSAWNFSYKVLEVFLKNNDFMEKELANFKRAQVLAAFCDHIFKQNADAWIRNTDFMDGPKLQTIWANWWGSRKAASNIDSTDSKGHKDNNMKKKEKRGSTSTQRPPFLSKPPTEAAMCKKFNEDSCPKRYYDCTIMTKSGPKRLYHLCSAKKKDPATGQESLCAEQHSKKQHK